MVSPYYCVESLLPAKYGRRVSSQSTSAFTSLSPTHQQTSSSLVYYKCLWPAMLEFIEKNEISSSCLQFSVVPPSLLLCHRVIPFSFSLLPKRDSGTAPIAYRTIEICLLEVMLWSSSSGLCSPSSPRLSSSCQLQENKVTTPQVRSYDFLEDK